MCGRCQLAINRRLTLLNSADTKFPDFWVWADDERTGSNPVVPEKSGCRQHQSSRLPSIRQLESGTLE